MHVLRLPTMGAATVLVLAFLVVPMLAVTEAGGGVVQVQSVAPDGRNGTYNASSVIGRKEEAMGGGGGGGGGGSSGGSSWGYGWGWGWGTEGSGGGGGGGGGSGDGGGGGSGSGGKGARMKWRRSNGSGSAAAHGRRVRHHRPSYSSSLYRIGEYARCTAPGRCRGMKLLCPMQCEGPCFYDCDANCKAHCRF